MDGYNTRIPVGNLEEGGEGHVKVGKRRITPSAIVGRESIVRRAKIGGRDDHRRIAWQTPLCVHVVHALDLKAGSTRESAVEQRRAQSCRVRSIPLFEQVPVTTRTRCVPHSTHKSIWGKLNNPSMAGDVRRNRGFL